MEFRWPKFTNTSLSTLSFSDTMSQATLHVQQLFPIHTTTKEWLPMTKAKGFTRTGTYTQHYGILNIFSATWSTSNTERNEDQNTACQTIMNYWWLTNFQQMLCANEISSYLVLYAASDQLVKPYVPITKQNAIRQQWQGTAQTVEIVSIQS